ncbi:MarR family transcriptional regulator [Vibrio fluvialis]|jgi:DNA-binding MarR family transcriptional regulator|uniref:MarR family transcriptional regulator n=2 Tax=Vibrio fluvialis TaxID=676 RepID=A0AAX2LXR7_VIBFL|nr:MULTISPECIES: MarR family transcriptional regulator [Vibrio]TNF20747.1 MAG: MarR family transcriptional regulator [Vibrionaceae bacterium]HDM8033718.1 MarR family transcriptional regulator [Vibrio fluvialis clinical-1]AMF92075.1 MarR family transcriptional regulator [Vibrio fluvialis]AVH33714.1 MarR family transcriptional regulator [Vibrio fluvialis]EKO3367094.1 MarR family transcriptional regulator [Vibrio fluvialis]
MDAIDRVLSQWQQERPQLNTLPMSIMGRMMRLTKHLETAVAEVHKRYGLKMGEFDVLATLLRAGAPYRLTPSELLASMMLTSGAMTNRLDKLEQKGLIHRLHSTADRRSIEVQLSDEGLDVVNELVIEHVKIQEKLVEGLSGDDQQQLTQLLKFWLSSFE